jgi:hypothetical protein
MYFGPVVSKDRIICKLEWLLKNVVEACFKGGQAATSAFRVIGCMDCILTIL